MYSILYTVIAFLLYNFSMVMEIRTLPAACIIREITGMNVCEDFI